MCSADNCAYLAKTRDKVCEHYAVRHPPESTSDKESLGNQGGELIRKKYLQTKNNSIF